MNIPQAEEVIVKFSDGTEQVISRKSWISREEKIKVYELMKRLEPQIKEEDRPVWEEIQKIVFQEKEQDRSKTYFLTGVILEKARQKVKKKESIIGGKVYQVKSFGQFFYKFKLNTGSEGQPNIQCVWAFKDSLDNPEEEWLKIETSATGERYEFEVAKPPKSSNFKVRSLKRL